MTRALVLLCVIVGCAGDQAPERRCHAHSQCDDGFLCGPDGLCTPSRGCASDGECCPGAVCFSGWCRPTTECGPGQGCSGLGDVCENAQCVPAACDALGGCAEPFTCVAGRCLLGPPCGGECGEGAVCDIASDRCVALAAPCVCERGYAVASVARTDGLTCDIGCECAALAPVPPGRPGVFGALLSDGQTVLGYEPEYGDLVSSRFSVPADLEGREGIAAQRTDTALDGVPDGGFGDGYRGGLLDPGPDRGDRPVVFERAGVAHMLYRDRDENRMRYGRLADAVMEASHPLPVTGLAAGTFGAGGGGPDLGVGRFACLADRAGSLGGLVFVGADAADQASLLVRIESRVATPTSEADWVATTVLETPLPPREVVPCNGACGVTDACVVAPSGGHACAPLVAFGGAQGDCACGAREVCGELDGVRRCYPRVERKDDLDRLPFGQGLFATCAATPSGIAAAWYDADRRRLVAARWPFSTADRVVVDEGAGRDPGHFAHLVVDGEALVVAYQDAVNGELVVAKQARPNAPWGRTIVPAGPGEHGMWVRGVVGAEGLVLVAGEGTTGDVLLFAERGCWASRRVFASGSFAFPDVKLSAGAAWVSARALVIDEMLVPRHAPLLARVALPACP